MPIFQILPLFFLIASSIRSRLLFYISFILLFIVSAFRGVEVGTDTKQYDYIFNFIGNTGSYEIEPLWLFLNQFIYSVGGGFNHVLIVSTFLVLFPIFYSVDKRSKILMLSVFFYYTLYYFFYSLNITRQSIGVSLGLLAITFLNRNNFKFIILVVLAALFHYSAVILLLLIHLVKINIGDRIMFLLITGAFVLGILLPDMVVSVISLTNYSIHMSENALGNLPGNFFYGILLVAFFTFLFLVVEDKDNKYFRIFFIYLVLSLLLIRIPLGSRLLMYYGIAQIIFFPDIIKQVKPVNKPILFVSLLIYSFFTFFRSYGAGEVFPYSNTLINF